VPGGRSQQELKRVAEYFSILRDWSLQRDDLKDRDEDSSTAEVTTCCRRDETMRHGATEKGHGDGRSRGR
jgi:hypothetical protein